MTEKTKDKINNEPTEKRDRRNFSFWISHLGNDFLLLLERLRRRLHMQMMIQIKIITAIRHPTRMATMIKGVSGQSFIHHIKWPVKGEDESLEIFLFIIRDSWILPSECLCASRRTVFGIVYRRTLGWSHAHLLLVNKLDRSFENLIDILLSLITLNFYSIHPRMSTSMFLGNIFTR